jgi:6-pyruvoyltetrahydropterin/6-carboxytetrahydropterin synthase
MYELSIDAGFSAAHNLRGYEGNCERLHGHNWKVRVTLAASRLNKLGMVADFRDVKRWLKEILGDLDHRYLNDVKEFKKANPTTENIARIIHARLSKKLPGSVRVKSVTAWESEGCAATYSR